MIFLPGEKGVKGRDTSVKAASKETVENVMMNRDQTEKIFAQNRPLAVMFGLVSLLIMLVLLLGIVIDGILISTKMRKGEWCSRTYLPREAMWGIWDVAKVVILFLFFGYMTLIIESALIGVFPAVKDDNFRMILNSSILDVLVVVFVLYFTVGQYKEKLISLGVSLKNFSKNVFYGIVGYIAAFPLLILILAIIAVVSSLVKYVPPRQPVVELFLKEKDAAFLMYTSLFAAIAGPIIEELFFRGFMYNAVKKYIGVFWAMVITAALFAALHAHAVGFLPIMVLGILLAYLYEKTGTLVSSMTVHMIHNLGMVFFVFLVKQLGA